jgi:site-specific recombinase XerC
VADVLPLPRRPPGRGELAAAVAAFCDHADLAPTTRRVYRASLAALVDGLGLTRPMPEVTGELLEGWFRARYAAAAPATWNRELATLRSAVGWWHANGWPPVAGDPTTGLARRREHPNRTRALTHGQLEALWRRSDLRLRDTALWRLLYETAARTSEALNLDVGDLDLANKRARVAAKAARSNGSTGRRQPPGALPVWSPGGPAARCSSQTQHRRARSPPATSTRQVAGPGCRTGAPLPCSTRPPGGRCTSCATRR